MTPLLWRCRHHRFALGLKPLILGIVNVTPDSFSDGGQFLDTTAAVEHGLDLISQGADLLDIGGESSRPGALPISVEEELERVVLVIRQLVERTPIPISVDTTKAEVARQCLAAGATIINDITGLRGDPDMPAVVAEYGAGAILMHMQGTPATMQVRPKYLDILHDIDDFFAERINTLTAMGIDRECLALDPGIGFGKTQEHTLKQLANLDRLNRFGRPICLGVSRKGFLGTITGRSRSERAVGSVSVACFAMAANAAHIVRVHDVGSTRDAVQIWDAITTHRDHS